MHDGGFRLKTIIEMIKEIAIVVLICLLFFSFILSQNKIPSGSMISTLNINDRILVSPIPFYYRDPNRGEIVVFHQEDKMWVKRVVGMPGDKIDIREGDVYINNVFYDEQTYLKNTGISTPNSPWDEPVEFPYKVPEDHYFLMGDNRMDSKDSRYIGAVSRDEIVGTPIFRIYPFNQIGPMK